VKKASLKDIALKAGVSITLVSYVLNNQKQDRISKVTAEKIRKAARQLNYRPNQAAKSLKTNKTNTIGLIVADISNPFFSCLAKIIEDEANKKNYTVIFGSSHEDADRFAKLLDTFISRQVDGMIIAPPQGSEKHIRDLQKQKLPFVMVDRYFPDVVADYVILDNKNAARTATQHLVDAGRKRIGIISYKTGLQHLNDRTLGYKQALKESGITFKKEWLAQIDIANKKEEIERSLDAFLKLAEPVDALFFTSNTIATLAVKYLNSLSIRVPRDLSLVCFDETEALDLFYAPLTYIRQPLDQIGENAINILMKKMEKPSRPLQLQLKEELIIRKSV
jgi:LacI family transcriptional regulator